MDHVKKIKVIWYTAIYESKWNKFISESRNGHFMFNRMYMEYHDDRFSDASLVVTQGEDEILAVMPANSDEDRIISHQGLTFGGLIIGWNVGLEKTMEIFSEIIKFLTDQYKFSHLVLKRLPDIYHKYPAQEDLYCLFRLGAKLIRRDVSSAILLKDRIPFGSMRKRLINKGSRAGVVVREINVLNDYWALLEESLLERHNVRPTHSLSEMTLLKTLFPNNIRIFGSYLSGELLGGVVCYIAGAVVHCQYLINGSRGRELGALDYCVNHLISDVFTDRQWFDFGISTEAGGHVLNSGLISQKEGFGARSVVHEFYEVSLA